MFRMWLKQVKGGKIVKELTYSHPEETNRTAKIFKGLEEACGAWELAIPIWLPANIEEFKRHARCRFLQDNFIESIAFDYMEIQVIEE